MSVFHIEGVIATQPVLEEGVSKSGTQYKKLSFRVETQEQFPQKVLVEAFNDRAEQWKAFQTGDRVTVSCWVDVRQWQDKNGMPHDQNVVRVSSVMRG